MEEIETLREENNDLQGQLNHQNELIQSKNVTIQDKEQEINQQQAIIDGYKIQLSLMEDKLNGYTQLEQLLRDARHRNNILVAEIERLNKIIFEQENEVEEQKNKCTRLDVTLTEYRQFELSHRDMVNRATRLADEVDRLKELLTQKHELLILTQQKLAQTEEELELERQKNAKLLERMEELESETVTEKVLKKILVLKTEIIRLSKIIDQQNKKLNEQQTLLDDINEKYNNQLRLTDDLRSNTELAEKKAKQAESNLLAAQKEIEQLKEQIKKLKEQLANSASAQNQALQDQIAKLQELLNNAQQNLRDTEQKLQDALNRLRDAESRIVQLERQVKDLDQMLLMNQQQAISQLPRPNNSNSNNAFYEQQIAALQAELLALRNAKPYDDRLLRRQIQDQLCLMALLGAEIDSLRSRK